MIPGVGNQGGNLTFDFTSTLVSVTQTNFKPTDFEIPPGYRDVTDSHANGGAEVFGRRGLGSSTFEGLKKGYDKGQPLLDLPTRKPVN